MYETLPDSDAVLAQFNRLIQELLRGSMNRNTFRPWEVELLLDIEACNLRDSSRRETLRRYQRAVQRHMEKGARQPFGQTGTPACRSGRHGLPRRHGQQSTAVGQPPRRPGPPGVRRRQRRNCRRRAP